MDFSSRIPAAGANLADLVRGVKPDQLDAPTPCPDWTVRQLVSHLMYWSPVLERAGRRQPVPDEPLPDPAEDLVAGDWQDRYAQQLAGLVDAWREPAAWTGTSRMIGTDGPASMYGGMVLGEFVLHGWDLARATGQEFACAEEIAAAAYEAVASMAEQGRSMGIFGPEVEVGAAAPALWRALAVSGRDPRWTAPPPRRT
jgi:uncharacterized protein (TIGR03086 family)